MTAEDLATVFDRQHAASRDGHIPTARERRAWLVTLADLLREHGAAFAEAISADFGHRSADETQLLEIVPALRGIAHARRHCAAWMRDERRPVDALFQPARAWVRHEPLGVVGVIAPWNYPLLLAVAPLTDALAAGNRAMIKPSELTPRFSEAFSRAVAQAFPADRVAVATGDLAIARAFAALPFDHLLFTGSTPVGREVMAAAAANLTPVTLELGGKSPALVAPDYALDKAAGSVAFGKFLNAGQTCIAPDYALVPQGSEAAFAGHVLEAAAARWADATRNPDYSAIISERHVRRLLDAIAEAETAGATVLRNGAPGVEAGRIAPTVVIGAPPGSLLMREEIFGPVLPVIGYRDIASALAQIRRAPRPLALYAFTDSARTRAAILDGAISGGVTINGTLLHIAQGALPFGGVGPSGMGAYHGRDGFLRLSHARAVHKVGPVNVFERLGPPWGPMARRLGRFLAG